MPGNNVNAFWQTLVAGISDATRLLAPTHQLIDAIFMDFKPVAVSVGQTLTITLPVDPSQNVTDAGTGDMVISDIGFANVPMTFSHHPLFAYRVADMEQFNSPLSIRNAFLDAAIKGLLNNINGVVAALFNSTNFATNSPISTTSHIVTTAQALTGYANLADAFVAVQDNPENMSFVLPSTPYTATLGDANWTQAQIAGQGTAAAVRATGKMPVAYGFNVRLDQQMPTSGAVGSRTFTGALFHRYAVAMATRPLLDPGAETTVVKVMYMDFHGVPLRIMLGYNHTKLGWIVSIDTVYALAAVRPSMVQLYSIAE